VAQAQKGAFYLHARVSSERRIVVTSAITVYQVHQVHGSTDESDRSPDAGGCQAPTEAPTEKGIVPAAIHCTFDASRQDREPSRPRAIAVVPPPAAVFLMAAADA
jgi:hypothetical protein